MEGIRSDDFAGLLAALGRGVQQSQGQAQPPLHQNVAPPFLSSSMQSLPQMPMPISQNPPLPQYASWNPQYVNGNGQYPFQQQFNQQPQQAPVEVVSETVKKFNIWIVIGLVTAVVVCAIIAWMRIMRVKEVEEDKEEEEEEEKVVNEISEETREIPPPGVLHSEIHKQTKEKENDLNNKVRFQENEDVGNYVASNILDYVNNYRGDEIDISGQDIPVEFLPPSPKQSVSKTHAKRIVADESQEVIDYAKKRESLFS